MENTLAAFTGNHGEMPGDLGCYQMFLPYEAARRTPISCAFPVASRLDRGENFVDLNDILPTLLDASNIAYPEPHVFPMESFLTGNLKKDRAPLDQHAEPMLF